MSKTEIYFEERFGESNEKIVVEHEKKIYILVEKMKVNLVQETFDNIRLLGLGKDYSDGLTKSTLKSLTVAFCNNKK